MNTNSAKITVAKTCPISGTKHSATMVFDNEELERYLENEPETFGRLIEALNDNVDDLLRKQRKLMGQ